MSPSESEPSVAASEPSRSTPRTARYTALGVGFVVLGLIAVLALAGPSDGGSTSPLVGARAPVTAGATLDGGSFDLDDHVGSWVAVNFFATWCPGCVNEHDDLVAFEQWGAQRGDVEVVSVVFEDPAEAVEAFFAERGGEWPVIDNPAVPVDYGVVQIPETFLVSPSGQVVYHVEGEVAFDQLTAVIEDLETSS